MKNWTFKQWNTTLGWVVFAISFLTYLLTMERELSFWDCGEYISSAVKLEVTHAPGAALYQIVGAVGAIFAFGNAQFYSVVMNGMSGLYSAFTILFLFWTITHLVRRMFNKDFDQLTKSQEIGVLFAGLIGSLAFAFSDTFWFSAVEGEVYAMASMFIALLVWLITKWENEYTSYASERWIILIFFLIGLGVGVHMMCMLALPCVCLIYYARNYKFTWKSFIYANLITLVILAIVFKGIFPFIMTMFGKLEIFFVNGIGLPFHSGTIAAFIIMIALCYLLVTRLHKITQDQLIKFTIIFDIVSLVLWFFVFGVSSILGLIILLLIPWGLIYLNYKFKFFESKKLIKTITLSIVYMIIGFSCWMVIPIRANANPPMNLNNPDTAIGMLDYYNREQYGDWPTSYGQNYTAYLDYNGMEKNEDGSFKVNKTGHVYEKDEKTGRYIITNDRFNYVYNKSHVSFMPRMFNEDKTVMSNYISMYGAPDFSYNYDNEDIADNPQAKQIFDELRAKYEDKSITVDDYLKVKPYNLIKVQRPSLSQNLDYFFSFQNAYYNWRYLMWNFVGRQNDLEGHWEITNGNWISGISFIDDMRLGSQDKMPAKFKNESTVAFYFLPFLLGLIGFFFQVNRDFGRFYALLSLFLITSVGIIFYTGVKPWEPRERDYAMVGSFYAFAIWIGLGAGGILWFLQNKVKSKSVSIIAGVVLLGIPFMMGFQNYGPHDRSGRTTAYDYSYSMLKSLPKNDILFVYGDNDTYPVWGLQETEQFRDDVKVVNFTLLATPWNIDQVKRRTYNSMPIPSILTHEEYRDGVNDQIYVMKKEDWQNLFDNLKEQGAPETEMQEFRKYLVQDSMTLKEAISFIKHKSPAKDEVLKMIFGEDRFERFNILPVNKFILPVNKANAVNAGIINASDASNAVNQIMITYKANTLYKSNLMMFDILANFDWKRPINFSSGGIYDSENIFYLDDYLQFDGFSYRLVPIHTPPSEDGDMGRVDANSLYNIVKNFRWGNFKNPKMHFDETATSNIIGYRSSASRAAAALSAQGQRAKAAEVLDLASKEIPTEKYNDPRSLSSMVYGYIVAGQEQKGLKMAEILKKGIFDEYAYYTSLTSQEQKFLGKQMRMKPLEYSLVVSAVTNAYTKLGQKDKAYSYLVKSLEPIDKKFDNFIKDLQIFGKEKAMQKSEEVQTITPFYQYLFDVMEPFDTAYAREKEAQITNAIIKATQ